MNLENSFRNKKDRYSCYILCLGLLIFALIFTYGLLVYNNPVPLSSPSFLPVIKRRQNALIAMAIAAVCQAFGTVSFQTVTSNKIITPSLLGFEAIYATINTSLMYFLGLSAFISISGIYFYMGQILIMVLVCLLLFYGVLNMKNASIDLVLLVGVVMGQGLRSISAFMRRVLSPSEFDVLQASLFASVNNARAEYFGVSIVLVGLIASIIFLSSKKLNILALGKDVSTNLGINYKKESIKILVCVSILMSVSTALVGPMTFFGFLVATLTYQLVKSYDHKYLLIVAFLLAYLILTGSYFLMNHIFHANGVVSILIEMIGGISFLILLFKNKDL